MVEYSLQIFFFSPAYTRNCSICGDFHYSYLNKMYWGDLFGVCCDTLCILEIKFPLSEDQSTYKSLPTCNPPADFLICLCACLLLLFFSTESIPCLTITLLSDSLKMCLPYTGSYHAAEMLTVYL